MGESRLDRMIDEMREYWEWLEHEQERVKGALTALGVPVGDPLPTNEAVMEVFRENPRRTMTASEVAMQMEERGWKTESKDPVNVVRTALARLANTGDLERVDGRGKYQLAQKTEDDGTPWDQLEDEQSSGSQRGFPEEPPF